ncbi:factor of interpulse interval [Cochliomyia hominivorax]
MKLIGLLLNLAVITGFVYGNHHKTDNETEGDVDGLTLISSEPTMVRYTNETLIVLCRSPTPEVKVHWKSPKGEIIEEHKGRIHIETTSQPEELKLVLMHISLADKGNWVCEDTTGGKAKKIFDLIVFQKITFTENTTILTVKEGQNATILCEVKGEPQPNITWHFNGLPISVDLNSTKFRVLGDGLLINTVTQNDTGEYTCRAYQVNPIASDMQERTVLMKIEHKPMWTHPEDKKDHYAYLNGTTALKCEAVAEPPGNFTWYRNKKQIHNDKHFTIENDNYISVLHIKAGDESVFSIYKCKVKNHLGSIERSIVLKRGIKPPTPHPIQLRGLNSHTFDIELAVERPKNIKPLMEVNGYRIEYMTEMEFKKDSGKWLNAKRKDFNYESGATFLLNNLEANTTYLVRAASRNVAGLSDWTKVEKFRTQFIPQTSASSNLAAFTHTLCFTFVALILSQDLTFVLPTTNTFMNLPPLLVTWNTGRL